jgi:putative solute:sodium symporter small subunit
MEERRKPHDSACSPMFVTRPHRGPFTRKGGDRSMPEANPTAAQKADEEARGAAHWKKTTNLMLTHLGIWIFFSFIIHMFVNSLNKIILPILQFPLGFYMAAQGSLIVFVVMLFVFAKQQDNIDREFGFAEDD